MRDEHGSCDDGSAEEQFTVSTDAVVGEDAMGQGGRGSKQGWKTEDWVSGGRGGGGRQQGATCKVAAVGSTEC
jgi:hypothetical protein